MRAVLEEFVQDVQAAYGKRAVELAREWPDLYITYQRAMTALKAKKP